MSKGLGPIQRAILDVLQEAGAVSLETALPAHWVHARVRWRLADRWRERPEEDETWLNELEPELRKIVLAIRSSGNPNLIPGSVSATISRALRTLERRGLIVQYPWIVPKLVRLNEE